MTKSAATFAVLFATLATACAPAADTAPAADAASADVVAVEGLSMTEETRRVPQFENEHVQVWKSIIVPNQPLEMHRHDNPRAIIALKGGTLTVTNDAGDSHAMTWETGSAYWLEADPPGELHGDVNEGNEPIEVIVVQLKGAGGS
jgi:quercetin dioxygenase-like cupin family protein